MSARGFVLEFYGESSNWLATRFNTSSCCRKQTVEVEGDVQRCLFFHIPDKSASFCYAAVLSSHRNSWLQWKSNAEVLLGAYIIIICRVSECLYISE